jgi:CDP-glycerol glycerophosphotransferase (TagB/SpsB family)
MSKPSRKRVNPVALAGVRIALGLFQVLYGIARLIPAADRIVFLSRQANHVTPDIAALRDELRAHHGVTRVTVLARKLNSDTDLFYGLHLLRQVWHLAHSERIVLDSYSFLTSNLRMAKCTRVVQMWHAIGSFKRFGWDDLPTNNPRRQQLANVFRMHAGNTVVIASSDKSADHFAGAFNIQRDRVAVAPLPRVDRLFSEEVDADRKKTRAWFEVDGDSKRVLLVAPTIRSELEDTSNAVLRQIEATGSAQNWEMWTSFHPVTDPIPRGLTTAELLAGSDAFLTDKSSMIYEAGLLGIPGFLWAPPEAQETLFAESYPSERELRPLIVETADELFAALSDPKRRNAAAEFASSYISIDSKQTATTRIAEIIASS